MRIYFGKSEDDIFFDPNQASISEEMHQFGDYIITQWQADRKLVGLEILEKNASQSAPGQIREAQTLLRSNGLLEGGSLYEAGDPLSQDGIDGPATRKALRMFQALILYGGNDGVLDGLPDEMTPALLEILRKFENMLLWARIDQDQGSVVDWPAPGGDVYDGYGSQSWAPVLRNLAAEFGSPLVVNDVSLPSGGPFVACSGQMLHDTHQTGIDVDFPLPAIDGSLRRLTWRDPAYDRHKMRSFLHAVIRLKIASRIWFNDPPLIAEGLCRELQFHDDHAHVRLKGPSPAVSTQADRDFWWTMVVQDPPAPMMHDMFEHLRHLKIGGYHPTRRHLYSLSGSLLFVHGVPLVWNDGAALIVAAQNREVVNIKIISAHLKPDHIEFRVEGAKAQKFDIPRRSTMVFDASSMPFPTHAADLPACDM